MEDVQPTPGLIFIQPPAPQPPVPEEDPVEVILPSKQEAAPRLLCRVGCGRGRATEPDRQFLMRAFAFGHTGRDIRRADPHQPVKGLAHRPAPPLPRPPTGTAGRSRPAGPRPPASRATTRFRPPPSSARPAEAPAPPAPGSQPPPPVRAPIPARQECSAAARAGRRSAAPRTRHCAWVASCRPSADRSEGSAAAPATTRPPPRPPKTAAHPEGPVRPSRPPPIASLPPRPRRPGPCRRSGMRSRTYGPSPAEADRPPPAPARRHARTPPPPRPPPQSFLAPPASFLRQGVPRTPPIPP